jgi:hypothetical protein
MPGVVAPAPGSSGRQAPSSGTGTAPVRSTAGRGRQVQALPTTGRVVSLPSVRGLLPLANAGVPPAPVGAAVVPVVWRRSTPGAAHPQPGERPARAAAPSGAPATRRPATAAGGAHLRRPPIDLRRPPAVARGPGTAGPLGAHHDRRRAGPTGRAPVAGPADRWDPAERRDPAGARVTRRRRYPDFSTGTGRRPGAAGAGRRAGRRTGRPSRDHRPARSRRAGGAGQVGRDRARGAIDRSGVRHDRPAAGRGGRGVAGESAAVPDIGRQCATATGTGADHGPGKGAGSRRADPRARP